MPKEFYLFGNVLSYLELGCCLVKQITSNFSPGASYSLKLKTPGMVDSVHVDHRCQQRSYEKIDFVSVINLVQIV